MPRPDQPPPGPAGHAAVAETHSGVVFFAGDHAYKLKKPLDLGFLDYRSREARQAACHREVELNRRLSPDVYLGVADVLGPDGQPCDHLVVMRRLPAGRRLATLAMAGEPVGEGLRQLARLLAAFHARAGTSAAVEAAASRDALAGRWEANATEMARFVGPLFDPATAGQVITLARSYLAGRESLIQARVAAGRARDGHGDLLADDIFLLDDGPRVLDCLEFDDALRWDDTLADVAFLAMDLERLGRADLAGEFLAAYREFAGDSWPDSLAHHHIAYRAQVRAKVTALAWEQAGGDEAGQQVLAQAARHLLDLAAWHLSAGRIRLVVIGGLPGTGKSTLAARVGEALDAAVFRSDVVRKELAGLDPAAVAAAPFGEGLYRPDMTDATYGEMLRRAGATLTAGRSVVLDASWHEEAWRAAARSLATQASADLAELRCELPIEVIAGRVSRRRAGGGDASDATISVVQRLAASQQPWPSATVVDTAPPPEDVAARVLGSLGTPGARVRPPGSPRPHRVPAPAGQVTR
ncbi:MAG TPA: AAA family ATPase [Streptosporangiaceae bacterium]|nr:AAA family ATPase [Streptosporangiaceae bacterium]